MRSMSGDPHANDRLTDTWLELTGYFLVDDRDILREFDAAGIGLVSASFEIVGFSLARTASEHMQDANDPAE